MSFTYNPLVNSFILELSRAFILSKVGNLVTKTTALKMRTYPFIGVKRGRSFFIRKTVFLRTLFESTDSPDEKLVIKNTLNKTPLEELMEVPFSECEEVEQDVIN